VFGRPEPTKASNSTSATLSSFLADSQALSDMS
jgi:hypothetical protein